MEAAFRLGSEQIKTLVAASKDRLWIDKTYGPVRQFDFGAIEKIQSRQINRLQELGLIRKNGWVQSRLMLTPTRAGREWIENNPDKTEEKKR